MLLLGFSPLFFHCYENHFLLYPGAAVDCSGREGAAISRSARFGPVHRDGLARRHPAPAAEPAAAPAPANSLACQVLTGRVTDPFAYPLTGATVMLRDHSKAFRTDAFSTNAEGEFILTSKQPIPLSTVLEVTAAGYTSFEVPLANCQSLDVTLAPLPGTRFKADGRIKKTAAIGRIR